MSLPGKDEITTDARATRDDTERSLMHVIALLLRLLPLGEGASQGRKTSLLRYFNFLTGSLTNLLDQNHESGVGSDALQCNAVKVGADLSRILRR